MSDVHPLPLETCGLHQAFLSFFKFIDTLFHLLMYACHHVHTSNIISGLTSANALCLVPRLFLRTYNKPYHIKVYATQHVRTLCTVAIYAMNNSIPALVCLVKFQLAYRAYHNNNMVYDV